MAFRLPFPVPSTDGRVHREEELTLARLASQRNARSAALETPASSAPRLDPSGDASPAGSPAIQQRHIVLPDPVAFRQAF